MHSYLQAIGFSEITEDDLDKMIYEAIRNPDSHESCLDSEGNEFVEIKMQVNEDVGIAIRGMYDMDDNFKLCYYYPYCTAGSHSSGAPLDIIRQAERECYQGVCDDDRLGVSLVFYLQNMMDFLQKSEGLNRFENSKAKITCLTALSISGSILLPVAKPVAVSKRASIFERASCADAVKEGNFNEFQNIVDDDMELLTMISRRIMKEDVYSIVSTCFMPYGIESDKYFIIADILEVGSLLNHKTNEEMYHMLVRSNDIEFELCINKMDIVGEPAVGRRFKGNVWMQGRVEF